MDIVERLRDGVNRHYGKDPVGLMNEAADEIERLREALQKIDACLGDKEQFWATRIEDAQNIIFDALHGGK